MKAKREITWIAFFLAIFTAFQIYTLPETGPIGLFLISLSWAIGITWIIIVNKKEVHK